MTQRAIELQPRSCSLIAVLRPTQNELFESCFLHFPEHQILREHICRYEAFASTSCDCVLDGLSLGAKQHALPTTRGSLLSGTSAGNLSGQRSSIISREAARVS